MSGTVEDGVKESSLPENCRRFFCVDEATANDVRARTAGTHDILAPDEMLGGPYPGRYPIPEDIGQSKNPLFLEIHAELVAAGWPVELLDITVIWPSADQMPAGDTKTKQ